MKYLTELKFIVAFTEFVTMFFAFGAIAFFCDGYPLSVVLNYSIGTVMSGLCLMVSVWAGLEKEKEDRLQNDPVEAEVDRITRLQRAREEDYQRRIVEGMAQPGGLNYNTGTGEWRYNADYNVISRRYNTTRGSTRTPELESFYQSQSLLERSVNEYEREQRRIRELVERQQLQQQMSAAPMIYITATQNRSTGTDVENLNLADVAQSFRISMDLSGSMIAEDKPVTQAQIEKIEEQSKAEVVVAKPVMNAISSLQINE